MSDYPQHEKIEAQSDAHAAIVAFCELLQTGDVLVRGRRVTLAIEVMGKESREAELADRRRRNEARGWSMDPELPERDYMYIPASNRDIEHAIATYFEVDVAAYHAEKTKMLDDLRALLRVLEPTDEPATGTVTSVALDPDPIINGERIRQLPSSQGGAS